MNDSWPRTSRHASFWPPHNAFNYTQLHLFFHVLKTGCKREALQLASLAKIERALALFMVVSWRIARLMQLGRTCPDLPASLMFAPDEIKAAYVLTNKPLPSAPPSLNEVVRRVAMLGGFLARGRGGEPGVKTIWIRLQRVMGFAAGVRFMRDPGDGVSCMQWNALNRVAAWRRKISPSTGIEYSLAVSLEFARNWSAASHRSSSSNFSSW